MTEGKLFDMLVTRRTQLIERERHFATATGRAVNDVFYEVLLIVKHKFPKIEDKHYQVEDANIKLLEIHNWFEKWFGDSS